ncbi:lysosomal acid glucosylceramidase-like isoform X2 [Xylocopa sonorina]|uniref:lysosomal acid glucosylceramidase-like isoform X2 n=1 Tax=Xylocopa sonorina TaxID=1818115 RepID=UPI00403A9684
MWKTWGTVLLLLAFLVIQGEASECVPRSFGPDRIVCVCNATYCDVTPVNNPRVPRQGTFYRYVSSRSGLRLNMTSGEFGACPVDTSLPTVTLNVNTNERCQTILGYGTAFTDSAGINLNKLSPATQDQLIRSYYDPEVGSRYTLGRIPIGGTDFSTRPYTYDDYPNDTTLEHFALAQEDYLYKIPNAKRAVELNPEVRFISAPWSAPAWMKTVDSINGYFGSLKRQNYQIFANYILRFIEEYKDNGIDIWAVSTGNEPLDALIPSNRIPAMTWTPKTVSDWIANNLGPTLRASNHNGTKILALDDQRFNLPWYVSEMFVDERARNYTSGIAVHWYGDRFAPPTVLTETHNDFPDKFILLTEACTGFERTDYPKVILGSWDRGEQYILSIIEYMNHWSVGWMDWNFALDNVGGPNWVNNFVDSPIIVNPDNDEFYKQPMYYALKHFSRFVDRGSVRVSITDTDDIRATAFVTPSGEVVVVLYNRTAQPTTVNLNDPEAGIICVKLPAYSINTIIYAQSSSTLK